ncbi:MAG: hypothetical protein HZA53_06210 [Planctomycetes bacterium]|nr:hypothetical protein [Planctomycetota bacterium]
MSTTSVAVIAPELPVERADEAPVQPFSLLAVVPESIEPPSELAALKLELAALRAAAERSPLGAELEQELDALGRDIDALDSEARELQALLEQLHTSPSNHVP